VNGKRLALSAAVIVVLACAFALAWASFAVVPASAALRPVSSAVPAIATTSGIALEAAAVEPVATGGFQNSTAFGAGAVVTFLAAFVALMLHAGNATGRRE
jgi:asparagine N-glycosylation enzyme membrane subunit Stt3